MYALAPDEPVLAYRVKIGRTWSSPVKRLSTCQTGSPVRLKLLWHASCRAGSPAKPEAWHAVCQGCVDAEAHLHRIFAGRRSHGEWFNFTTEDEAFTSVNQAFLQHQADIRALGVLHQHRAGNLVLGKAVA